jgi:hypothetical protein
MKADRREVVLLGIHVRTSFLACLAAASDWS